MTDTTNDWTARDDWTRDDLTFGELYWSIFECAGKLGVATTEVLMRAARAAQLLLNNAICIADDQNNERFFEAAYEHYGQVIDAVLKECGRNPR